MEQRARELKARHDRKVAEMKRGRDAGAGHFDPGQARGGSSGPQNTPRSFSARSAAPQAAAFSAANAPPPAESLRAFFAAANKATSMEQLLVYLPLAEQRALKEYQAAHDPQQAAKNRAWRKKQNPQIDERTQTYLSNSPYVNELDRKKRIAAKFLDVLSVNVEGNKALIEVSTTGGGTVNGVKYPYGTAEVEMLGEGSAWKFQGYNDSNVMYLNRPQPKQPK
jgi:hypothetical protein